MERKIISFTCPHCKFSPRFKPPHGVYYCPKCGKRSIIGESRKRVYKSSQIKKSLPKKQPKYFSDYENMMSDTKESFGLKERYLNPQIKPLIPKKRKDIKLFIKSN